MRLMIAAAAGLLLAACSGAGTDVAPPSSTGPTPNAVVDTPTPATPVAPTANVASEAPTPEATPEPSAAVNILRETIRPCTTFGTVQAMIIVELENAGTGWAELGGGDYTVYDKDESVVTTGSFTYSYPKYLGPGQKGYLADHAYLENVNAKDVKRVETSGTFDDADPDRVIQLKTAKVKVSTSEFDNSLYATGTVTNSSTTDVGSAHVAAFFLDGNDKPLGFAYTNLIDNLGAGRTKGFKTTDSGCPIKRSAVKKTVTLAGDDNF